MKIAFPTRDNKGMESPVFGHFGSAPHFLIVDSDKNITYKNVIYVIILGLSVILESLIWTIWKYIAIGIWEILHLLGKFLWYLFKIIHSRERILCAVDGTIGGTLSYFYFSPTAGSFPAQVTLVIFGGLLGMALGVLNWEIISKRILRIAPVENQA